MTETSFKSPSPETIPSFDLRERRLQAALETVTRLSHLVGNELAVKPVVGLDGITDEPGVYIIDDGGIAEDISGAKFNFLMERLSGAADSAHSVIPGELVVNHGDSEDVVLPVVAKCYTKREFSDRFTRMQREVSTMQAMLERDELTTVPIAVVVADNEAHLEGKDLVVITHYKPDIITMDNFSWSEGMTQDNKDNALLGIAALSKFNRAGFHHGDAKIKNVAQDQLGEVGMIDYETTVAFDLNDAQAVRNAVYVDVGLFLKSLKDRGFFGTRSQPQPAGVIREFLDELELNYLDKWQGVSEEVSQSIWSSLDEAMQAALPGVAQQQGYYELAGA